MTHRSVILVSAVLVLASVDSFSEESATISAISDSPPHETRAVRLLNYVDEPSVLRHRTIALDVEKIVAVLESSAAGSRSGQQVLFPFFDDASFVVRFTYANRLAYGWIAYFEGFELTEGSGQKVTVRGDLSINLKTGEILAALGWDRRQFAIHFTGDQPFHLVVENDPAEMPDYD